MQQSHNLTVHNFREDAYETDEGGDVRPAVLHEWIRTISNHVCDVLVETVRTFGTDRQSAKSASNTPVILKLLEFTDHTPSRC